MSDSQDVLKKLLESLRDHVNNKSQVKCLELIGIIAEYFAGPITASEINLSLKLLFTWDDKKISIQRFLAKSLHLSKSCNFNECNKKVFELIQSLAKAHRGKLKPYVKDVISISITYMQSPECNAYEKECAVLTIHELIFHDALSEDVDLEKIIVDIMSIFYQKAPPKRLQQRIFELLGMMSKTYPKKFINNTAVDLRNKMMNTIQSLFKDDKADISLMLVSGAVDGLKNHLVNFTPTIEEDPDFSRKLYECMVQLSDPDRHATSGVNRVAFRHMLEILTQFGSLHDIPSLLFNDYKTWQSVLLKWVNQNSYQDKIVGVHAMQAFHQQIANVLEQRRNDDDKRVLLFFMKYFQDTLEKPDSQPHEIRIAIRGFGAMAAACKLLLEPKFLSERFDLVMQRTEYSYNTNDRLKRREVLEHLPHFVESLSKIMNQLEEISGIQIESLESIFVILIKDFHFLSTAHHALVASSMLEAFLNLQKSGGVLDNVLESVVLKGVLRTCEHQLTYDLEVTAINDWKEAVTYKNYLPLWQRLLSPSNEAHFELSKIIYSHFIKDLFWIIDKLDLSTKKRKYYDEESNVDKEFFFSDPSWDLEPTRAENFHVLYNLVLFYGDAILAQSTENLQKNFAEWLELWLEKTIKLSFKHPLVSAFPQLIEIALTVIDRLDYATTVGQAEARKTIEPLGFYVQSMLLLRCQQMSGELQIACLKVIFQVPSVILKENVAELSPIFKIGFTDCGKGILTVANLALTCLERIVDSLSEEPKTRRNLLEDVLPCLETFLSSQDSGQNEVTQFKRGQKKQHQANVETDLVRFKKRVLLFLGHFDPDEAQLVLSKFEQRLVRDHITNVFQIKLECNESTTPLIDLDGIVERVSQLAVSSSERATKIAACELLHCLALYMMGMNLNDASLLPLWKELCCKLVILGADKDQTVRELFEPLLMQMMHHYSQRTQILTEMAKMMIESLMVMIAYRGNNGVQDLSARLLREFLLWLNRHVDRESRQSAPIKLVDLFHEMRKMSIETDEARRTGATLAFNNIYRIIREEESLIDVYWIYLLDVFGTNFKSSEDFSISLDSNFIDGRRFEQVSSSMDHLARVFVERSDIFHRSNSTRIRPIGFSGITLPDVLNWLFKESGSHQYHYRHKCMGMFVKILPECGTKEEIYEQHLSVEKVLSVGEANGIAKRPDLKHLSSCQEPIFKEVHNWMQSLLTSLDFYIWIFENDLMTHSDVGEFLERSVMLYTISYFLKNIVYKDMMDLLRSINESLLNTSQISGEKRMCNRNLENIDVIRSIILVRVVDLLTFLMKEHSMAQFLEENKTELVKVTKKLIFKPQRLGFDYKSKSSLLKLPKRLTRFVTACNEHAPLEFKKMMMDLLQKKLLKNLNALCQSCDKIMAETTVSVLNINKLNGIDLVVSYMKEFLPPDILGEELLCKTAELLLKKLSDSIVEMKAEIYRPRYLKPSTKKFAVSVMQLCLKIDVFLGKIIAFSFNQSMLRISENCTIRSGEHFMQTFKEPIYELFTSMVAETIRIFVSELKETSDTNKLRIMAILAELNEFIYNHHKGDKQLLQDNMDSMIAHWPAIIRVLLEMENDLNCVDLAIINLSSHMAMVSPIEWHELGQRLEKFQAWIFGLLENQKNSLEIKSKAIFLLPFVTSCEDKSNEKLMKVLGSLQQKHLPLKSREFPDSSLERAALVTLMNAVFKALLTSRSPVLYRFIINVTIADNDYILETKLQKVQIDLMDSMAANEQEVIVNQTFDAFMNGGYFPEVRLSFVTRFLLTVMKNCKVSVMMSFMIQKMTTIWSLMESSLHANTETSLVNRCGAFMMIEAFFASVPSEDIIKGSYFYAGKSQIDGTTLVKDLIKRAVDVRTIPFFVNDKPELQELFRKLHCYSYRAVAAIVSNTKDNSVVYNLALFKESDSKLIWQHLIDVKNENLYVGWTQDFEEMPRVKEYIVSVKDLAGGTVQRKYIETISIFDHSLSQSLTKNDLSYSVVFSNREAMEREQQRHEQEHQATMKVHLDSTPINDHEVMSVLVGVVNHLNHKITPFMSGDNVDDKKYEWVKSLAIPLANRDNHKNVRIFIAKLVDNCRGVFSHYAKVLLGPILSVIADRCIGETMNFFITDLVTMLLSWNAIYKPTTLTEKEDACATLKFLMENAHHDRDEIFKLNLELIKKFVETWKEILEHKLPTQSLLDLLQKPLLQESIQKLRCGLQLNAVILANDLVPWRDCEQRNLFIKAIVRCFYNKDAKVYQAAAQLLGMCLSKTTGDEDHQTIVEEIRKQLDGIRQKSENDVNVFLQLLYSVQKSFPPILDSFLTLIKFNIPRAVRKIKCMYLEMYLSRLEIDGENVFREIITIGVKELLKQNEYQLLALHIVNKAVDNLTVDAIGNFMEDFNLLARSPRVEIRRILVEMMIFIVEKFRNVPTLDRKKPMRIILKGFTDSDQEIQHRVSNFLSAEGELAKTFVGRFQELLENYYDPSLEKEFLHYATQLLLDIPVRHPQSKRSLLKYDPTKNKDYFEVPITIKSITQRSMPPMFIQSQQQSLLAGDGSTYGQVLRATQLSGDNHLFSQTVDPVEMTQVSQTFAFKQTQNSLFFSLQPQFLDRRSKSCTLTEDTSIEAQIAKKKEGVKAGSLDYLRQRVVRRDESGRSKEFALRAIERRNKDESQRQEKLRQSREGKKVVLYRRYRRGDFPDFFFTSLAMLMPLQALTRKDDVIARDVFISIFQSIIQIVTSEDAPENAEKDFFTSINKSVMSIMQQTKNSDSFLMATLVEMAMKSEKYLEISPDVLANVATANNMMVTGVLFLESQLKHLITGIEPVGESDAEPTAKRPRIDEDDIKMKHWLKLIELYYRMNEYEVVAGVFTEKLNLVPETRDQLTMAIDLESSGRFVDAKSIYRKLIGDNCARNPSEKEFYYQSYFHCLENLSDWREITKEIRAQFDSYNEVWDEAVPFHKQTLLPHLMRSELRILLNEDVEEEFINVFEEWVNDEERRGYLRDVFPEEFVMINVLEKRFPEGCVEAEKALRNFADEWSGLEMLDEKLKCLQRARNIAEITNFIYAMTSEKPLDVRFEKIYQGWRLSQPKPSDSLVDWNDLLAFRKNFQSLVEDVFTLESQVDAGSHLLKIKQSIVDVAFQQRNCDAAKFIINGLFDEIKAEPSDEKISKYCLFIGRYNMMVAEQKLVEPHEQLLKLYKGLKKMISGVISKEKKQKPDVLIESFCCASDIAIMFWKILEKSRVDNIEVPPEIEQHIIEIIAADEDDNSTVADHLLRYSETSLKKARNHAQKYLDDGFSAERESMLAGTYLKLGQFYHQLYGSGTIANPQVQLKIIQSIFRAIAYGSNDAKVFIPYILQLKDLQNNGLTQEFNQELNMVPEWMFINYISQMLSSYDFENECFLDELILKLAEKYPNALFFPFKLSRDNYKQTKTDRGMEKENVSLINEAISNPALEKFTKAVQCLVMPEKMLETHFQNFKHEIDANVADMTNEKFQAAVGILYNDVYIANREMKGANYQNIAEFKKKIQDLTKMKWSAQQPEIIELLKLLNVQVNRVSRRTMSSIELHKLCNWLAEYKWCGEKNFIEIPGQYDGDMKPFVEQHVKIVRFDSHVKVFASKQRPIELKIHGSDGKTYSFIIKYGEDLRQDQRIQQALELMSRQLMLDKNCKQNRLQIQTYQVVPINSNCGMLSVVQNAKTVNEYLADFMKGSTLSDHQGKVREAFRNFLIGGNYFTTWPKAYEKGIVNRSRQELVAEFINKESSFENDIIQKALMNSALTLETFYILRKNFITSLTTMNIAHWLLGIGDRHLSNILIDIKTGRLIGIDFGVAFGAATTTLMIPELVPFRLTSHFVNVMEPMGIEGIIKKNMIHALRCLRDYGRTIVICLEVFVKEPTLDWQQRSKKICDDTNDLSLASSAWNPESRVAIVQRKLEGASPLKITKDELLMNTIVTRNERLLQAYMKLIDGEAENSREHLKDDGLSVEEQVACLIDLATDKALLACVYLGWDPWI